jgi:hypothetical protein
MADPITNFIADIPHKERKWKNHTITPFAKAWINAFENFKQTLKDQKEADDAADKLKFELAMLALSLCSGGILTAAFGTAAAKTLATNAAVDIICRNNMERAFKAAHFVSTNKTASFIAGKVWDEAEKRATDALTEQLKTKFAQNAASFPSIGKFRTELDMYLTLDGFVSTAAERVNDIAVHVRDHPSMPEQRKVDEIKKLATSPFWRPSEKDLDIPVMTDEIELSMYMNLVLESDSLETFERATRMGSHDGLGRAREYYYKSLGKSDITESAGSPNYPKPSSGEREIHYRRIGSIIQGKMNDLHRKKFGGKFHDGRKLGSQEAILAAERGIGLLAATSIKRTIEDAGVGLDPNRNLHLSTGASGFPLH